MESFCGGTFRAVYTVKFANAVYVLHCFQKKSTRGIVTPKPDMDLIRERLKAAQAHDQMFESRMKVKMVHVPYKGGALAINDLLGDNVDMLFAPLPEALPHIKAGKLFGLAIMGDKRSDLILDVPTMAESGIDNMTMVTWIGLLAPAKLPRPLVDQINKQVHAILATDEVKAQLRAAGMDVAPNTPEQFKQIISDEIKIHAELVKAAGLVPQ